MTIKKSGFVFAVAFGFKDNPPTQVSLCKLFWKFVAGFCIGWPVRLALVAIVVSIISIIICFFAGKRIDFKSKSDEFEYVKIPYLHRFSPFCMVIAGWLIFTLWISITHHKLPLLTHGSVTICEYIAWAGAIVIEAVMAIVAIICFFKLIHKFAEIKKKANTTDKKPSRFKQSVQLAKSYIKARKQKICPIVTIE